MNDLDRIVQSLATAPLSARDFERFAQDTLVDVYPGLSPIPGGTDWGRDADIAAPADGNPVRLIATSSRTLDGIRKNMRRGLKSMADHGVVVERIALANPANLGLLQRQKLAHAAAAANVRLDVSDIFDGNFVASRLRRDGYWRKRLLGLPSEPLSLSRTSPDLAEGPGGFLPFVARTSELESIRGDGDLILTGPPGVGKTRLVSELDDVAFVDKDASFEQVTADLRWATPTVVVIDDAGRAMQLVRRIRSLRAREPDLFTFRMIAICWPHEVDDVAIELSGATLRELALIERKPLDDLLRAMGVNAQIARAEILDQAEGRPGWVITLAQLLLQSDDTTALITGRAVFDQVDRYLRRTGIGAAAIPVLAIVAALGGIVEGELTALAKEVELSRAETIRTLTAAMKSGLIDTHETYDPAAEQSVRTYLVRPPTLAEALVAQRAFEAEIPTLDFDGLIERRPDKRYGLACAAVNAAVRQAHRARGRGESLVLQVLHDHEVHVAAKVRLATLFMQVDRSAAEIVVSEARGSFDAMLADGSAAAETIEPIVELAARGTRWYQDPAAILILLDASLLDGRGTNQHPRHPLRELQNLIVEAHPELPRDRELRYAIAAIATTWFQSREDEPVRDEVVAKVFQILLSISLRSAYSAPGDPMTLQLIESIVPAEEMPRILDELWPQAATLIDAGAAAVADALVDVAGSWLHVGHDYDHPFGRSHPADRLAAARQIGERLVDALANRSDLSLGTRARLAATAEDYGLAYDPLVPAEFAPFFRDLDRDDDWEAALERLNDELRATAHKWSGESPQPAMQRLADLKTQSGRAQTRWPDRIWQTASFLAEAVADPGE